MTSLKQAIAQYLPKIPKEKYEFFFWNYTCFPCGTEEDIIAQIQEHSENTVGTLEAIEAYVTREMDKIMDNSGI